jgi:Protein of unknown function (DUF2917)
MRIELESPALRLPRGKTIRVRDGAGHTLITLEGSVWITEENSIHDVVLRPGQRFEFTRPGIAIVEAFGDASISFG